MTQYNFTAFENSDLFSNPIAEHETFVMPTSASLAVTVTDDDAFLSGDAYYNELGDDHTGQHASILRGQNEIGNLGRLYVERVWSVSGDDGQTYHLAELEQPGHLPDNFTFVGSVPSAGTTLTINHASNVSGHGISYSELGGGAALPNIVEIAAGSDDFNILVMALTAAGLVDAVQNSDDITVFAPSDAAFASLAADLGYDGDATDEDGVFGFLVGALTDLGGGDPIPLLTDILLYHVSPGAKTAAEVDAADQIQTLLTDATFGSEGTELIDNEPDVANANIVVPDIAASNGNIQVLDKVLLPIDIPGNTPLPNIVEIAAGSDDFNILVMALTAAGLVDAVQNSDDITVFAPSDAAFASLAADLGYDGDATDEGAVFGFLVGALTDLGGGDPIPLLTDILLYHVSPGAKTAAEVDAADQIQTLLTDATFGSEGTELIDNEPDVANPNIVVPDIAASNGNIQVLDKVLLPIDIPGNTPLPTLTGIVAASGGAFDNDNTDFDLLLNALQAADLAGALDDPNADLTVFAPNDAAFIGLAQALGFDGDDEGGAFSYIVEALTLLGGGDPIPLLTQVLTYHVAPGSLDSGAVLSADAITTLQGGDLGVDGTNLVDADPDIANPGIIATDIAASNGIAHVIDGVLLPADLLKSGGNNLVDFIIADDSNNRIGVGRDNDFVDGNGGSDRIYLGMGDDVGLGGDGGDLIDGGWGNDLILGEAGNDKLLGRYGDDTISGGDGSDYISGGDGADDISGGDGNDLIKGGRGDDSLAGDKGNDLLLGGRGNDDLSGGNAWDLLIGGTGDDNLSGGSGRDFLRGGWNNDTLAGGTGDDWLVGGAGSDTYLFNTGDGYDRIYGFSEGDKIDLSGTGFTDFSQIEDATTMHGSHRLYINLGEDDGLIISGNDLVLSSEDFMF